METLLRTPQQILVTNRLAWLNLKTLYMTKINVDNKFEVFDQGTVIQFDKESIITLTIEESDGTPINLRFLFKRHNELNKQSEIKIEKGPDENTIDIRILIYGGNLNFGPNNPIPIGTFNRRELFFTFRLSFNNYDDTAIVFYNWYLGKEVIL